MSTTLTFDDVHYRHWTPADRRALQRAGSSLPRLCDIALEVKSRMPEEIHLISGSITSGGVGSIEGNWLVFRRTIEHLIVHERLNVFSVHPFQAGMHSYHTEWARRAKPGDYCWDILFEFYLPFFTSCTSAMFHFIHGYESSRGATWEHQQCLGRGFKRRYLPAELSAALLEKPVILEV